MQLVPPRTSMPSPRPHSTTKPRKTMCDASLSATMGASSVETVTGAAPSSGGQKIDHAGSGVDDELARLIQFLEHIQRAVAPRRGIALHEAVDVRRGQRDPMRCRVHRRHANDLVVPVVAPVALKPDAVRDLPLRGPVARVLEDARPAALVAVAGAGPGFDDPRDGRPALVRPAGQLHALVAAEQLRAGRRAVVIGRKRRRADAQRLQVRLPHFAACGRIEPLQGGAVLNRLPGRRGQLATAFEADVFTLRRFPDHRAFRSAGILRAQDEAGGEFVNAAAHDDLAGLGLPGAPHRLPRALEGAKRASSSSGIGIAAIGGDIESAFGACRQTGERDRQAASQESSSSDACGRKLSPPPVSAQAATESLKSKL